ncbi:MAG TPA: lyase family protein [Patescibacteria group bacterium]|nr:lyase family protein [Patescibacteria group bacterium]
MQKFYPFDFEIGKKNTTLREGTGISNLDGRLWDEMGSGVGRFFGDEALVRGRVAVEARYIIALSDIKVVRKLNKKEKDTLLTLHQKITPGTYKSLRKIESKVKHDVISMTLILKHLLAKTKSMTDILDHGWVHWGLSSEDVDNIAKSVLLKAFLTEIYLPHSELLLGEIVNLSLRTKNTEIPGKTHLQTAIPTVLGKEIALFGVRLAEVLVKIKKLKLRGKLTGAVGNLSAHRSAYPRVNWRKFSKEFVEGFGLEANLFTTQTEPKARFVELLSLVQMINSLLIDLSQDARLYIGFDWLKQEVKREEAGSSAMPQKVNPIDFENSQGNALFSNWILEGMIRQFPVSWLQRDLVDKTIQRNTGLPFGYSLIAIISAQKGLSKVSANREKIKADLESDWGALSEAFQVNLRAFGVGGAYNDLKAFSRGKRILRGDVEEWIRGLGTTDEIKKKLFSLSFEKYTGYAAENLRGMINTINSARKTLRR